MAAVLTLSIAGAAEMAGYLSRWDRNYLKSYEAMAAHRYNFTTFAAEPNVLGASWRGRGTVRARLRATAKAAEWLKARRPGLSVVGPHPIAGSGASGRKDVRVIRGSSDTMALRDSSVDIIWTDPPYHDDLAYHDLSAPLRAWARLGGVDARRSAVAAAGGTSRYERVLIKVFAECHRVLKPGGSLLLTFANREPAAWVALFRALRAAGFRARGYEIVRADAEADHAKRSSGSSTMDVILDLCKRTSGLRLHRPPVRPRRGEPRFLFEAGEAFLEAVDPDGPADWEDDLRMALVRRLKW